ncbi:hypothetical protein, partial [Salmonella enterica]|uniref:hypothetical protein n=1 Tax=Salmonella enterica TaxID=28901 RepID=UPI003CEA0174
MQESHSVMVKTVLRGSAGEQAGLMAGDEWLGIGVGQGARPANGASQRSMMWTCTLGLLPRSRP